MKPRSFGEAGPRPRRFKRARAPIAPGWTASRAAPNPHLRVDFSGLGRKFVVEAVRLHYDLPYYDTIPVRIICRDEDMPI